MSAMVIVSLIVLGLAILCFLVAIVSIVGALQSRSQSTRVTYGVGRQDARRSMRIGLLRGLLIALVGVILLGVFGLTRVASGPAVTGSGTRAPSIFSTRVVATETVAPAGSPTVTPFSLPTGTATLPPAPSATSGPPSATIPPTATETPPPSAIVSSEVGLFLREAPGGVQELELLPVGTVLILLPGRTTLEGEEWQQVRTPSGMEGWVAVQFITYQQ
jgi:hypothetical protein